MDLETDPFINEDDYMACVTSWMVPIYHLLS